MKRLDAIFTTTRHHDFLEYFRRFAAKLKDNQHDDVFSVDGAAAMKKLNHGKGYYVVTQTQSSDRVVVHAESRTAASHALGDVAAWVLAGPFRTKREALGRAAGAAKNGAST